MTEQNQNEQLRRHLEILLEDGGLAPDQILLLESQLAELVSA